MASMANLRVLIVIVVFFGVGFGLYTLAAQEMADRGSPFFDVGVSATYPNGTSLNPNSFMAWNVTNATSLSVADWYVNYDLHGWSWTRWTLCTDDIGEDCILVETYDDSWSFITNREDLIWTLKNGTVVSATKNFVHSDPDDPTSGTHQVMTILELDTIYGHIGMVGYKSLDFLKFDMSNSKGTFEMQVSFDESLYADPPLCLSHGGSLSFSVNQDFSDRKTSINILDFIMKLFTFNTPSMPYPINILISGIWYGCIVALAYVVLSIIRSFIPFLGGGD